MWDSFWDYFWSLVVIFAFFAYLIILFQILVDLFWRDHKTSGWVKALWVLFLILFPYLTALIYLIARGGGMADRAREQALQAQRDTDEYIRRTAGRSPAQEIADAKALLDTGAISPDEFESLKARALRESV
ncbi:SHOCT domain-containing protein [Mycolicibacterium vaccae]|uniref:SHOCT domain-containing protein n=1 Tax=Mycolicibacterium vaccae TaxID=1810 RepID=UPI003CE87018